MTVTVASLVALAVWGSVVGIAVRRRRWMLVIGGVVGLAFFVALAPTTCVVLQSYGGQATCRNLLGVTTTASGPSVGGTMVGLELRAAAPLLAGATIAALVPAVLARRPAPTPRPAPT